VFLSLHGMRRHYRLLFVTFRVRRSRGEMYIGYGRLCVCVTVCLSVPHRMPTLLHGHGCNLGEYYRGCPLVVHYWAYLQSVHGFRCCDNIASNAKCQRVLVLALCLVCFFLSVKSVGHLLNEINEVRQQISVSKWVKTRCVQEG